MVVVVMDGCTPPLMAIKWMVKGIYILLNNMCKIALPMSIFVSCSPKSHALDSYQISKSLALDLWIVT